MTTRTRLVTYLDHETAELVRTTADALDQTTSALLADMVSYAVPMLEVLRDMSLAIKASPDDARARIAAMASALRPMVDAVVAESDALAGWADNPPPLTGGSEIGN